MDQDISTILIALGNCKPKLIIKKLFTQNFEIVKIFPVVFYLKISLPFHLQSPNCSLKDFSSSDPTITHCYAAPERIDCDDKKNEAKFDCTADVWSLGLSNDFNKNTNSIIYSVLIPQMQDVGRWQTLQCFGSMISYNQFCSSCFGKVS